MFLKVVFAIGLFHKMATETGSKVALHVYVIGSPRSNQPDSPIRVNRLRDIH